MVMGLLLGLSSAMTAAGGESAAGRWAGTYHILDNGEEQKAIISLSQHGSALSGTVRTLDWTVHVTGSARGSKIELFVRDGGREPVLLGVIEGGQMQITEEHITEDESNSWIARRATPADELLRDPYIKPPRLHRVSHNGLAKTPPMGWNSWNLFRDKIDDHTVRGIADALEASGMRDAGYVYVNIDDTWEGRRDPKGNLTSNRRFPDMKGLADYLHSKGLKLGIYSAAGPRTCVGYPGSYGHEVQDARTFAEWGIDYLKYDTCSVGTIYGDLQTTPDLRPVFQKMGDALAGAGRPIVYSLGGARPGVERWAPYTGGNLWRTSGDIRDSWSSMIGNVEGQIPSAPYAGPGHWNDPDMLEVGNGGMSDEEYRTHMSLWALVAAPLLAGNDIQNMTASTKAILLNQEVIAVDQDPLGKQASPIRRGHLQIWVKPLSDASAAVGVVNLSSAAVHTTVHAGDLGLRGSVSRARDLWSHQDVQFNGSTYTGTVPPHGILLLRVWGNGAP